MGCTTIRLVETTAVNASFLPSREIARSRGTPNEDWYKGWGSPLGCSVAGFKSICHIPMSPLSLQRTNHIWLPSEEKVALLYWKIEEPKSLRKLPLSA